MAHSCVHCSADSVVLDDGLYVCIMCGTEAIDPYLCTPTHPINTNTLYTDSCTVLTATCEDVLHLPEVVTEHACHMYRQLRTKYGKKMHGKKNSAFMATCVQHACSLVMHINAFRTEDIIMRAFGVCKAACHDARNRFMDTSVGEPWYMNVHDVEKQSHTRMITLFLKTCPESIVPDVHHAFIKRRMLDLHALVLCVPELAHRRRHGVFAAILYLVLAECQHAAVKTQLCLACHVSTNTLNKNLHLMHFVCQTQTGPRK